MIAGSHASTRKSKWDAFVFAQKAYTFEDLVHLTCKEATAEIGSDADRLGAVVAPLADYSRTGSGLAVPTDRPQIGQEFGKLPKAFCTVEPASLSDNDVDLAIRRLM